MGCQAESRMLLRLATPADVVHLLRTNFRKLIMGFGPSVQHQYDPGGYFIEQYQLFVHSPLAEAA